MINICEVVPPDIPPEPVCWYKMSFRPHAVLNKLRSALLGLRRLFHQCKSQNNQMRRQKDFHRDWSKKALNQIKETAQSSSIQHIYTSWAQKSAWNNDFFQNIMPWLVNQDEILMFFWSSRLVRSWGTFYSCKTAIFFDFNQVDTSSNV